MEDRARAAAEALRKQHESGEVLRPLGDCAPRDLAEAYAVQDAGHALAGADIAGWKIALTTPVMQQFVGIDHPLAGAIFRDRVSQSGVVRAAEDLVHFGVESEIAVRLGADVPARPTPYDRDSIAPFVATCMAAIEVVDDRDCDYGALDAPTLAADNAFNAGCVLGPERGDWGDLDLAALAGRMEINGEVVGEGTGADVLGHPMNALAWLATHLGERGRALRAGDVVLTGSVVTTQWLRAGDEMATEIEGLGRASLTLR